MGSLVPTGLTIALREAAKRWSQPGRRHVGLLALAESRQPNVVESSSRSGCGDWDHQLVHLGGVEADDARSEPVGAQAPVSDASSERPWADPRAFSRLGDRLVGPSRGGCHRGDPFLHRLMPQTCLLMVTGPGCSARDGGRHDLAFAVFAGGATAPCSNPPDLGPAQCRARGDCATVPDRNPEEVGSAGFRVQGSSKT